MRVNDGEGKARKCPAKGEKASANGRVGLGPMGAGPEQSLTMTLMSLAPEKALLGALGKMLTTTRTNWRIRVDGGKDSDV